MPNLKEGQRQCHNPSNCARLIEHRRYYFDTSPRLYMDPGAWPLHRLARQYALVTGRLRAASQCGTSSHSLLVFDRQRLQCSLRESSSTSLIMWLDRFSNHPTPSHSPPPPLNRSHSPAPQRGPSQLGSGAPLRPGYGPRISSLNSGSRATISTTSVNSQRLPNGSALKHEVTPPADFSDPLEVLERIIGRQLPQQVAPIEHENEQKQVEKPPELVADVDFGGLSLTDFVGSEEIESKTPEIASQMTAQTVEECEYV